MDIDLNFRPASYFGPQRLEEYLFSKIKSGEIRSHVQELFRAGRHSEVRELLGAEGISTRAQRALEAVHPALMGGNYLPDPALGEVEIGRIRIRSTTGDVTSVYAKLDDGAIRYRVVDEYNGDTLAGPAEKESRTPLTLSEFMDFFLSTWPLMECIESNGLDLDTGLDFFLAESTYYPNFDSLCRQRVTEHFSAVAGDER